jgi:hypothetical protein
VSTFEFTVYVEVDDWDQGAVDATEWPERTEQEYAHMALYCASLRDAKNLDGYADLGASAGIASVEEM